MNQILLIDGQNERHWIAALRQIVSEMNKSLVLMDSRHMGSVFYEDYELIILDASISLDLTSLIAHIHSRHLEARVVVVSSAPHWKQVREILLAGAIDYGSKADSHAAMQRFLQRNLSKALPARKPVQTSVLESNAYPQERESLPLADNAEEQT
jgi:response regulator of citrate/malate metabolism